MHRQRRHRLRKSARPVKKNAEVRTVELKDITFDSTPNDSKQRPLVDLGPLERKVRKLETLLTDLNERVNTYLSSGQEHYRSMTATALGPYNLYFSLQSVEHSSDTLVTNERVLLIMSRQTTRDDGSVWVPVRRGI